MRRGDFPSGAVKYPGYRIREVLNSRFLEYQQVNRNWNNIPFAPRRCPFFYGWVIVAASTVGTIASIPGQTMGVGVFTDSLIPALSLSRDQLSTAYMIGTIISSLILPFAGRLLDTVGGRVMAFASSLGLGFSVAMLSQSDRLANAVFPNSVLWTMVVITVCFLMLRFWGQGCLTMVSRVMLGKWFNHHRGLATAISGLFVSFGFSGSPLLLNTLIEGQGWRGACLLIAGTVGCGVGLLAWLFFRDKPEDCGLVMDGNADPAWLAKMEKKVAETRKEFTRGEALRTISFWAFSMALAAQGLIITAVSFHVSSIGEEMGLTRDQVYFLFLPMSVVSVSTNFIGAWLSDRIRLKWLLVVMMAAQAVGTCGLLALSEPVARGMYIVGYGIAGGLFGTLVTVTWPRFFGRAHLGAISGVNMSIMVFASAIGPKLFSWMQAMSGSYRSVTALCLAMPVVILLMGLKAENPQEHVAE